MNHRIFERIWHPRPRSRVCLSQSRYKKRPRGKHAFPMGELASPGRRSRAVTARAGRRRDTGDRARRAATILVGGPSVRITDRAPNSKRTASPPLQETYSTFRPEIRQDHPLNLSISISGGKETNQDSLSNGERNGKSPT